MCVSADKNFLKRRKLSSQYFLVDRLFGGTSY